MAAKSPVLFAFACVAMPMTACDRSPTRTATGEEIEAAVKNAEMQMVQARAKGHSEQATAAPTREGG